MAKLTFKFFICPLAEKTATFSPECFLTHTPLISLGLHGRNKVKIANAAREKKLSLKARLLTNRCCYVRKCRAKTTCRRNVYTRAMFFYVYDIASKSRHAVR